MKDVKAAIIQNRPSYDKNESINRALGMIKEAAGEGAALVTLPEIFYHPYELKGIRRVADTDSRTLDILKEASAKHGIYLCTGSIAVRQEKGFRNTSYLLSPSGDVLLEYSKTHLFDVELEGMRFKESAFITPGEKVEVTKTPVGTIGLLVCYDIRFPEMARKLALMGAEIIIVPAAFNPVTGPAHWHVVFRGRALENQVYMLAASQARVEGSAYEAYGHSMIVDPWGEICAEAKEDEKIIYSDLKASRLEETRKRLPLLAQRRPHLYETD
jgi:predicted amidohydrolase